MIVAQEMRRACGTDGRFAVGAHGGASGGPVAGAGCSGIADGVGLAAALAFGAEGVSMGTRFLALAESPLLDAHKQAIVPRDGHNTLVTEIPDVATGTVWPGAYARTCATSSKNAGSDERVICGLSAAR